MLSPTLPSASNFPVIFLIKHSLVSSLPVGKSMCLSETYHTHFDVNLCFMLLLAHNYANTPCTQTQFYSAMGEVDPVSLGDVSFS